ncbi:MAG: TerC/Alx family metal homeostasis membrane protein [Pedosphaera sp.]|nr:TerC/Alx family metal homeostasis membrane protein [Pedosphaera sp.]
MPTSAEIHLTHWLLFFGFVLVALGLDLGLFHRKSHLVRFREATAWTIFWVTLALTFGLFLAPRWIDGWTRGDTAAFLTGYIVELSLSMDNVFVIAVIFQYFKVPPAWQHRVLFWGILGALVMRGVMILGGTQLIERFHFLLYLMGALLLLTGLRMLKSNDSGEGADFEKNPVVRLLKRYLPLSQAFDGERFTTRVGGVWMLTPLALVLAVVESTDVLFALDSIPAIFGVTTRPFLIFTSNVFAILGLRSLYFVLASAMGYFRYLKLGLAVVLIFIGIKMLAEHWLRAWLGEYLTNVSLAFVVGVILVSMAASIWVARREMGGPKAAQ